MKLIKQLFAGALLVCGALYLWAAYVPASRPLLERWGVLDFIEQVAPLPSDEASETTAKRGPRGPVRVVAGEVSQQPMNDQVRAIGDGRAIRSVTVRAEATGRIVSTGFVAGGYVNAGDELYHLEDAAEKIAVERARLQVEAAKEDVDRLKQLQKTGAVTAVRFREAELELRSAELALEQARFDLAQRTIVAPISGWAGLSEIEVGDRISVQDVLTVITDRSHILIDFRVPERAISQLSLGMPIQVVPLANPDQQLIGKINAIDNIVDRHSRTLRVQGQLENEGDTLRAGMAFSVALSFPGEMALAVDPLSVQWSSDGPFLWKIEDSKAQRVAVKILQRNSGSVLVEGALNPGDAIIVEGVQNIRPGAEVEAVEGTEPSETNG
ncbi:MAG: efflux RND transporter periplasmic adaptor subunit [Pseudophaeobacter sp. bin_em_oilr2.035]|uniref:Efflux RND transporter periplasmic adaptor subunit n=1 Tax=Phaeobacter gallaeciensis TaxID=60890 RepID=A0ABD4XBI0_9RHOB|nr:efflux RND transporter periplasmic adaptor subunit [Phaeobacter gallaeciensis]MDF1772116.1 efflux RND transporter periplasmic adaptor subunit [Pseudophaeobacter sp. bin_em_oilr2.035]MDE4145800.1 efflux RND transporter periplasmic adaptor subunit [Phaeobacter gallaeciensis]MDE4158472.1 efflux RND transporter periplasmic adaptor subunit [Phaeobacter gallaeciensis]MDE4162650.1 efflux RND transporter periplasmic adaptor subunit [Phaeobacter gallaeciensis]MDE4166877.1 efflux RND transporter peri